jgi:hypothetical protein
VPLQIAPIALVSLLWFFPCLTVALGILALAAPACCKNPAWQKVPSGWLAGCIMCQAPCLFLIAALLWPASLVIGDVCASGPNVGAAILPQVRLHAYIDILAGLLSWLGADGGGMPVHQRQR